MEVRIFARAPQPRLMDSISRKVSNQSSRFSCSSTKPQNESGVFRRAPPASNMHREVVTVRRVDPHLARRWPNRRGSGREDVSRSTVAG